MMKIASVQTWFFCILALTTVVIDDCVADQVGRLRTARGQPLMEVEPKAANDPVAHFVKSHEMGRKLEEDADMIEELAADYDSRMMLESYSMSISMSMAMEGDYRSRMMMESYSMSIYMLTSTSMSMSMAGEYGSRMLLESLSMSMDMSMSMFG